MEICDNTESRGMFYLIQIIDEAIERCSVGAHFTNKVNSECLLIALQQDKKKTPIDLPHVHYMVRTLTVTAMNRVRKRKSIGGMSLT